MKDLKSLFAASCVIVALATPAMALELTTDKIVSQNPIEPNKVVDAYTNCVIKGYGYGLFSTLCSSGVIYSDKAGLQHEMHYPSSKKDATSMTKDAIIGRMKKEIERFGTKVSRPGIEAKIRINIQSTVKGIANFTSLPGGTTPGLEAGPLMTASQPAVTVPGLQAAPAVR